MKDNYSKAVRGALKLKKDKKKVVQEERSVAKDLKKERRKAAALAAIEKQIEVDPEDHLTAAEKAFRLVQKKREAQRIDEKLALTHRQRIEEFNTKLSKLTEREDVVVHSRRFRHAEGWSELVCVVLMSAPPRTRNSELMANRATVFRAGGSPSEAYEALSTPSVDAPRPKKRESTVEL